MTLRELVARELYRWQWGGTWGAALPDTKRGYRREADRILALVAAHKEGR